MNPSMTQVAPELSQELSRFSNSRLLIGLAVYVVLVLVLAPLLSRLLLYFARRTKTGYDDAVLVAARGPVRVLLVLIGAGVVLEAAALPERVLHYARPTLFTLVVLTVLVFAERLATAFARQWLQRHSTLHGAQSFVVGILRGVIFGLGGLVILDSLGVSITPLLGTLGVGSLAVALGLQDTLGQIFAGIHVTMDQPVRLGDFVRLESGDEGWVRRIGWRTTRIESPTNSLIAIPNTKIASSIITNFYLPMQQVLMPVTLQVAYESDLAGVETACLETARGIQTSHPDAVKDYEPVVRFREFADSGIVLTVTLCVRQYPLEPAVRSEFLRAVHARFGRDGIVIPYPVREIRTTSPS
jgi:small-conductance mechanosensitive channel